MLKITAKDRIFAAVAIPLLLLAAYLFLLRLPLARDVAAMRARLAALGSVDTLRAERATLDRRLAEARASLQAAEATTGGVDNPPAASPTATHLHNTLSLLTSNTPSGTRRITAYERLATGPAASPSTPRNAASIASSPVITSDGPFSSFPPPASRASTCAVRTRDGVTA